MAIIKGTRKGIEYEIIVDEEDFEFLNSMKWHIIKTKKDKTFYAKTSKDGRSIAMHRILLEAKKGQLVDHVNGNGLDNRRKNLRFCTYQENARNFRGLPKHNSSGAVGVYWNKKDKKWRAQIKKKGKLSYLGSFDSIDEAMARYWQEAEKISKTFVSPLAQR